MNTDKLKDRVINWHSDRFPLIDNSPNPQSEQAITELCVNILAPIEKQFGEVFITYGFTSHNLLKEVLKDNPAHIAPKLDQHSSFEFNSQGKVICNRAGSACDIIVKGLENNMYSVAKWIADHLPVDRMYLYGKNRPIHLSYGPENSRFVQVMNTGSDGKRTPGKRGASKDFNKIVGYASEL